MTQPPEADAQATPSLFGAETSPQREAGARPDPSLPGGIPLFFLALAGLAIVRVLLGYVSFPLAALPIVNPVLAVVFLSVPILALFFAGNSNWTWRMGAAFVGFGLAVQIALVLLVTFARLPGPSAGVLTAIGQGALACWCTGLGVLLATLIREKNIILPIAIFLAAYDFFLVLTPFGYGEKLMKLAQPVFTRVAGQIPVASAVPTHGLAQAQAYVGMADFVFLGMFFVALFRFQMRTRQTLFAVLPALIAYLFIVIKLSNHQFLGFELSKLPAMVPIGLAVLIVNWREFNLKRDEKIATTVLAVLAIAFLTFAATRPKPRAEPGQRAPVRAPQAPAG